jgi:hypothetical protein
MTSAPEGDLVNEVLKYYAEPGPMTTLDGSTEFLAGLPDDPLAICRTVPGVIVHEQWAGMYGVTVTAERLSEPETRAASDMTALIQRLDPRPLVETRPQESRMIGNCRHFSTLSCALLRHAGRPARARCGFATYFEPDRYVDHWVVEYWDGVRWVRVDAQLDTAQQEVLKLDFDPSDVPAGRFLTGAEAWQLCRSGQADPERFGIFEFWGAWFVRGNVVRDLASLNKMELLPWDGWGLMERAGDLGEDAANAITDDVAAITLAGGLTGWRDRYESDALLRVPETVMSYRTGAQVVLAS